jgi:hypothetical protein
MADQLVTIPLISPALYGLNKSQETSSTLGPQWATEAQNCYFDSAKRLASRSGWAAQAITPISGSPNIEQVHEFVKADGTVALISAANNKLYTGTSSYTDVTGAVTPTANSWQFVNFVDQTIGFQAAHTPIVYTGAGNFAVLVAASGALPTGNTGCAAFGRLWAVDADGYTVKFCGLLDATNWGNAGSGSINMRSVWTKGTDAVIGIYATGSALVIFGSKHICIFRDGAVAGSTVIGGTGQGLNPTTMIMTDIVEGTGLIARDTVQNITDGDLLFYSTNGLQSLSRAIYQKNNPVGGLDTQIKDYVYGYLASETKTKIRSAFSRVGKFYLLLFPTTGRIFCYDTLFPMEDGRLKATEWVYGNVHPRSIVYRLDDTLVLGVNGVTGLYTGNSDNGTSFRYVYASSQLTGATQDTPTLESRLKILKRLGYLVFCSTTTTIVFKWGYDFSGLTNSSTVTIQGGKIPEYGTAEYGTNGVYSTADPLAVAGVNYAEYGGNLVLKLGRVPTSSLGRWLQVGVEVDISNGAFAIQELDAYTKIGRMT